MRWRERITLLLITGLLVLQARPAAAAALSVVGMGDGKGPTNPAGLGDLLPSPNLTGGDTKTLYEAYPVSHYYLDSDTGHGLTNVAGPVDGVLNAIANLLMTVNAAIAQATIAITWWVLGASDTPELLKAVGNIVGLAAGELSGWLLPSALAIGAAIAYAQHRNASGSGLNQLAWVLIAGFLAVSFTAAPQTWVAGIDTTRTIGTDAVLSTTSSAVSGNGTQPFEWEEPAYTGSRRDTMLRKSGDAIWRAYAVTPWCLAEFGSLEACERYGKDMLELGADSEARQDYIWGELADQEGMDALPTVQWTAGNNPTGRIGILMASLVAAVFFAVLVIGLGFASLMAYIGALLMLIVGVFFAMLWCIPGAPRRWGISWFYQLTGLIMQSVMATLVFGSVLVLTTALFSLTATLGWLPVAGLTITVCLAASRFRRVLESVTGGGGAGGSGAGAGVLGYMAVRSVSKLLSRGRGGGGGGNGAGRQRSSGNRSFPSPASGSHSPGDSSSPRRPQRYREFPPPGSPRPAGNHAASGDRSPSEAAQTHNGAPSPGSGGPGRTRRPGSQPRGPRSRPTEATGGQGRPRGSTPRRGSTPGGSRPKRFRSYPSPGEGRRSEQRRPDQQVVQGEVIRSEASWAASPRRRPTSPPPTAAQPNPGRMRRPGPPRRRPAAPSPKPPLREDRS